MLQDLAGSPASHPDPRFAARAASPADVLDAVAAAGRYVLDGACQVVRPLDAPPGEACTLRIIGGGQEIEVASVETSDLHDQSVPAAAFVAGADPQGRFLLNAEACIAARAAGAEVHLRGPVGR